MLLVKGHIIILLRSHTAAAFCSDSLNLCASLQNKKPSGCPGVPQYNYDSR